MSFLWIEMLWLLLLIPVLVVIYVFIQYRRQKLLLRYSSLPLTKRELGKRPGMRRHIPPILFLVSLISMVFAMTRPTATVILPSQQATVILAIDVSRSMRAEDIKPSRLEAAKVAALTFVEEQPQDIRIGVVSFSGYAAVVQAPTNDREAVAAAINRLTLQHRTAVGSAILTSLDAIFEESSQVSEKSFSELSIPLDTKSAAARMQSGMDIHAVIILLSDGRNTTGPSPLEIIEQATNRGVRIYTVGIGNPEGTLLGFGEYSIYMRFDEETLKLIAEKTDAEYFRADNETDLRAIYEHLSTQLVFKAEQTELSAIFTGIAVLLALFGGALSIMWFNRLP